MRCDLRVLQDVGLHVARRILKDSSRNGVVLNLDWSVRREKAQISTRIHEPRVRKVMGPTKAENALNARQ